jgi:2-C-methyl-D-erythritol 2,4-cyclodiphosphate synthase
MRIGNGWDSHEFKAGIPLKIGGVSLPYDQGLGGHSDGDVLLHAITDALLGAIAAPDIGTLFPPSDSKWKGADSAVFLREALKRVKAAGYKVSNVDSTLILAAPKIGPHAQAIRERVAELMSIMPDCVGVKAKTPEGMGTDNAAMAHAVVLLERSSQQAASQMTKIGVISDTHGLLRPEAVEALRGSDFIIHAGDIGDRTILSKLGELAPVTAVRGNVDLERWARKIPETNVLEVEGTSIYVLHDLHKLDLKPETAGFVAIICGHSHVPKQEFKNGVLYFNPGSAGPRRFRLPVSLGRLIFQDGRVTGELMELAITA